VRCLALTAKKHSYPVLTSLQATISLLIYYSNITDWIFFLEILFHDTLVTSFKYTIPRANIVKNAWSNYGESNGDDPVPMTEMSSP